MEERSFNTAQSAFNELVDHLLGTGYYIEDPVDPPRANKIIVDEILDLYRFPKKQYPRTWSYLDIFKSDKSIKIDKILQKELDSREDPDRMSVQLALDILECHFLGKSSDGMYACNNITADNIIVNEIIHRYPRPKYQYPRTWNHETIWYKIKSVLFK